MAPRVFSRGPRRGAPSWSWRRSASAEAARSYVAAPDSPPQPEGPPGGPPSGPPSGSPWWGQWWCLGAPRWGLRGWWPWGGAPRGPRAAEGSSWVCAFEGAPPGRVAGAPGRGPLPLWLERGWGWLLLLLLLLLLLSGWAVLAAWGSVGAPLGPLLGAPPAVDYGVVIDCGSHGSRVNVFRWQFSPGLAAAFGGPPGAFALQLQQMVAAAAAALAAAGVAAAALRGVPLYVKATAGLRALQQQQRDLLLQQLRLLLQDQTLNPFFFRGDFARVLSGEEEAAFSWVAANALQQTLGGPPGASRGALELGGSSAQIAFSPAATSLLEGFFALHLGPLYLRLYAHSFLAYGWAERLHRASVKLAAAGLLGAPRGAPGGPREGA
ncbi:hypothetical protein ENH_00053110, partial [Eimeria necatrix]